MPRVTPRERWASVPAAPPSSPQSRPVSGSPRQSAPVDPDLERLLTSFESCYVWKYGPVKEELRARYSKAKREQWNGAEDLDWSIEVDPEIPLLPPEINPLNDYAPYRKMSDREQKNVQHGMVAWQLSQFMHGEQGALIVASQLVGAVPWMEAKFYASSQTMDEARHVEVFSRWRPLRIFIRSRPKNS